MKRYESHREFQLWTYTVNHGMLLVRSCVPSEKPTIDLIFHGTKLVSLPRHLKGISVTENEWDENKFIFIKYPNTSKNDLAFTFISGGNFYYVIAAGLTINQHENGIFWDPF